MFNFQGFVPRGELSTEFIQYPDKVFFVGQVVRCQVLSCDPETEKAVLTFKVTGKTPFGSKQIQVPDDYEIGKVCKKQQIRYNETFINNLPFP